MKSLEARHRLLRNRFSKIQSVSVGLVMRYATGTCVLGDELEGLKGHRRKSIVLALVSRIVSKSLHIGIQSSWEVAKS